MRIIGHGLGPGFTMIAYRISVIFSVEGLEFRFTFLTAGSCSAAAFSSEYLLSRPPPITAMDDLKKPRRMNLDRIKSDMVTFTPFLVITLCLIVSATPIRYAESNQKNNAY